MALDDYSGPTEIMFTPDFEPEQGFEVVFEPDELLVRKVSSPLSYEGLKHFPWSQEALASPGRSPTPPRTRNAPETRGELERERAATMDGSPRSRGSWRSSVRGYRSPRHQPGSC